jgi:signal transduction histidine kinase/ligand-binding sensor domain-containing protein
VVRRLQRVRSVLSVIVAVVAFAAAARAADGTLTRTEAVPYHHTVWSTQEGAPAEIWALTQGRDGYLWIGTGHGLYQFDGVRFSAVSPAAGEAAQTDNITALYAARDGSIWIGYYRGGASVLRAGRFTHYRPDDGALGGMVIGFAEDDTGRIWAASYAALSRFDGTRWISVTDDWGYPATRADFIVGDDAGTLWVASPQRVYVLRPGTTRFEDTGEAVSAFASLMPDRQGALWVSDSRYGTRRLGDTATARAPLTQPFLHLAWMRFDDDGSLWGTDRAAGGVVRARTNGATPLTPAELQATIREADGLASNHAIPLYRDREGNFWVGTNLGLSRFRHNNVQAFADARFVQRYAYAVTWSPAAGLLASAGRTLYRIDDRGVQAWAELPQPVVALVPGRDRTIWALSAKTIHRIEDGHVAALPPLPSAAGDVALLAVAADGSVLVQHETLGLFRYDGDAWQRFGDGPVETGATALQVTSDGTVWTGYANGTVVAAAQGRRTIHDLRDHTDVGVVGALQESRYGLIVGGERGVALIRDGRAHAVRVDDASRLRGITGVVEDAQGDVWLSGVAGVIRVPANQLDAAHLSADAPLTVRVFDEADGLPGVALQSAAGATAVRDGRGRIWFATNHGLAFVEPDRLRTNPIPPPIRILGLRSGSRDFAPTDGVALPEGTTDLRIDYTALSLSHPDRVRFRYRLAGLDTRWQDAGNRREAFFTNLPPGSYAFDVQASNDSGIWNTDGARLTFSITPHYSQTRWFAGLIVFGIAALLFVFYLRRVRLAADRVRVRLEERHLERERIARELHDTLLQSVHGLVLRFQAVANRLTADDPVRTALESALDRADGVIAEGRDRVRALRASQAHAALSLPEAFAALGAELAECTHVEFRVIVEGRMPELDRALRDEIYCIGREMLTNAFRHSEALHIEVEISRSRRHLRLRFRDDGRGIGEDVLQRGRAGHWGLAGMQERAQAISAQFHLWSRTGQGTEAELVVPLIRDSLRARWRRTVHEWLSGNGH